MQPPDEEIGLGKTDDKKLKKDLQCKDVEELLKQKPDLYERLSIAIHCNNCEACKKLFTKYLLDIAQD